MGEVEGKRPLGRPRRKWVKNIEMGLEGIRCGGMDCHDMAQGREQWRARVNVVMNLQVP
jgi:hypothetical protein